MWRSQWNDASYKPKTTAAYMPLQWQFASQSVWNPERQGSANHSQLRTYLIDCFSNQNLFVFPPPKKDEKVELVGLNQRQIIRIPKLWHDLIPAADQEKKTKKFRFWTVHCICRSASFAYFWVRVRKSVVNQKFSVGRLHYWMSVRMEKVGFSDYNSGCRYE